MMEFFVCNYASRHGLVGCAAGQASTLLQSMQAVVHSHISLSHSLVRSLTHSCTNSHTHSIIHSCIHHSPVVLLACVLACIQAGTTYKFVRHDQGSWSNNHKLDLPSYNWVSVHHCTMSPSVCYPSSSKSGLLDCCCTSMGAEPACAC